MAGEKHKEWNGKTGGTLWMQRALICVCKVAGLRPLYAVMAAVVPFYMLFSRKGYVSAYRFFRRRMGYGRLKSFVGVYRNHFVFGQIIIDRFAVYAGRKFKLVIDNYDLFLEKAGKDKGFIMLSSHVGNYEMAGYLLVSGKKPFKALVYGGETATVMSNRLRVLGNNNIGIIPILGDMSHVFAINDALSGGEILSMSGDRLFGSAKSISCDFLGGKAKFPLGPFALARQRDVDVLAVFVMKESVDSYHVYIKEIKPAEDRLAGEDARAGMGRMFAAELERVVRDYPTQWFNYYDFWR